MYHVISRLQSSYFWHFTVVSGLYIIFSSFQPSGNNLLRFTKITVMYTQWEISTLMAWVQCDTPSENFWKTPEVWHMVGIPGLLSCLLLWRLWLVYHFTVATKADCASWTKMCFTIRIKHYSSVHSYTTIVFVLAIDRLAVTEYYIYYMG